MTSAGVDLRNDPNRDLRTRLERGHEDSAYESVTVSMDMIDLQTAVRERLEIRIDEPSRRRRRSRR